MQSPILLAMAGGTGAVLGALITAQVNQRNQEENRSHTIKDREENRKRELRKQCAEFITRAQAAHEAASTLSRVIEHPNTHKKKEIKEKKLKYEEQRNALKGLIPGIQLESSTLGIKALLVDFAFPYSLPDQNLRKVLDAIREFQSLTRDET
ncbi:hypothetical protein [Streptomyces sp. NPDC003717]|uniref:hypothetical protein n=1 Tax=Streptomyces sp. NPDC003717 TaxID=3154276 RepID=UPI0033BA787D